MFFEMRQGVECIALHSAFGSLNRFFGRHNCGINHLFANADAPVGKKVDRFYGDVLETKSTDRPYQKFSERYVEIETDIRSLVTRNRARALNEESTQISEIMLKLWVKYKDNHKLKDTYSDGNAKLDRNRFIRLFSSAASAEVAKKLDPDDKNAEKDSK